MDCQESEMSPSKNQNQNQNNKTPPAPARASAKFMPRSPCNVCNRYTHVRAWKMEVLDKLFGIGEWNLPIEAWFHAGLCDQCGRWLWDSMSDVHKAIVSNNNPVPVFVAKQAFNAALNDAVNVLYLSLGQQNKNVSVLTARNMLINFRRPVVKPAVEKPPLPLPLLPPPAPLRYTPIGIEPNKLGTPVVTKMRRSRTSDEQDRRNSRRIGNRQLRAQEQRMAASGSDKGGNKNKNKNKKG